MDHKRYDLNEGVIPFPDTWEDQSINVFVAPDTTHGASLTITRDTRVYGEDEDAYLKRQLKELAKSLKNFSLVQEHEFEMAGQTAKAVEVRWRNEGDVHVQLISFKFLDDKIIIFTGSSTGVMTEVARKHFIGIMKRFTPREQLDV